jgi:hypothetical protein
MQSGGNVVGGLGIAVAGFGALGFASHVGSFDTSQRVGEFGAIAAALVGGVLALRGNRFGGPLVAGATTPFIAIAVALVGVRVNDVSAFAGTESKSVLAAGMVGLVAAVVALAQVDGRGQQGPSTIVCLLALGSPYGVAAILQIDRTRSAGSIGQFLGFLAVAAVIGAGIYKGWLGAVTSVVAAVLLVPNWVDAMSNNNNRAEAALIALSTSVLIVVIGLLTMAAGLTNRPDQSAR